MGIPFEIRIGLSKSHNQLARDPGDETWVQKIYQRLGHTPYRKPSIHLVEIQLTVVLMLYSAF